jgi:hypothetical protein
MKKIIALSGISGVGKTYRRTTDPALKDLPFVDIADIYAEFPYGTPAQVFAEACYRLQGLLEGHDVVVIEAALLPDSRQRPILAACARSMEARVEYVDIPTPPRAVLLDRILNDFQKSITGANVEMYRRAERYFEARRNFIKMKVPD